MREAAQWRRLQGKKTKLISFNIYNSIIIIISIISGVSMESWWLTGISMEGDDALLADMDVKVERTRDEWMTTLPPERKVILRFYFYY